jgi:hypothetical protein
MVSAKPDFRQIIIAPVLINFFRIQVIVKINYGKVTGVVVV